jgi:hypothetical protein
MKHYDGMYDLQEELMCADFDTQLGPILLEIEKYCDLKLKEHPGERLYKLCKRRIEDKLGEVAFLKVMVGRSPSFREVLKSDCDEDFFSMWSKNRDNRFLDSPEGCPSIESSDSGVQIAPQITEQHGGFHQMPAPQAIPLLQVQPSIPPAWAPVMSSGFGSDSCSCQSPMIGAIGGTFVGK